MLAIGLRQVLVLGALLVPACGGDSEGSGSDVSSDDATGDSVAADSVGDSQPLDEGETTELEVQPGDGADLAEEDSQPADTVTDAIDATDALDATDDRADREHSLVVSNWEGYMSEDLVGGFGDESGVKVEVTHHGSNDEIVDKLLAGNGERVDVAFVSLPFAQILDEAGLLADIDATLIPNLSNLYAEARALWHAPEERVSVPYTWGTTGLCYREDLVTVQPSTWTDLLEPSDDLLGRVTMLSTDRWLLAAGQKSLGFSINTTNVEEMSLVKDVLLAARDNLLAFDDTTFFLRLVDGEVGLVHAWDGWCNYAIAQDPNVTFVVPENDSDLWVDTMVILKASDNVEAAHAFINYVLEAENHRWVVDNLLYKVPNEAAMELIDPTLVEGFPSLGLTPAELTAQELMLDVGEDGRLLYSEIATEVRGW